RRVQALANDYGWWEDAYNAYLRKDDDWWWANVGSSVVDTQIADMMAIISPEGTLAYGWMQDEERDPNAVVTPTVIEALRDLIADMPVDNLASRSAFLSVDGEAML